MLWRRSMQDKILWISVQPYSHTIVTAPSSGMWSTRITFQHRIHLPLSASLRPGHDHSLLFRDQTRFYTRHGPDLRICLVYRSGQIRWSASEEANTEPHPYCLPSLKPGSRSVRIIRSSSLVPPIYFIQSSASW